MRGYLDETWEAHGCTVCTVDRWEEGNNLGGKQVAITYDPEADDMPTEEMEAHAEAIACLPDAIKALRELHHQLKVAPFLEFQARFPDAYEAWKKAGTILARIEGKEQKP